MINNSANASQEESEETQESCSEYNAQAQELKAQAENDGLSYHPENGGIPIRVDCRAIDANYALPENGYEAVNITYYKGHEFIMYLYKELYVVSNNIRKHGFWE
eukprot:UN34270